MRVDDDDDVASVPMQRRITLVRARFATVRASYIQEHQSEPSTYKYKK